MRICVFEDANVGQLEPLTLARPAFALRCGALTLLERQRRYFSAGATAVWARPHLADVCRLDHPGLAINDPSWVRSSPGLVGLVNARWLALGNGPPRVDASVVGIIDDEVAYAVVPAEAAEGLPDALPELLARWKRRLPNRSAGGRMIAYPWDLIERNAEALEQDSCHTEDEWRLGEAPPGVVVIGPRYRVALAPGARVEPLAVLDATHGPVLIDEGAVVQAFSRVEGPCYVGPGTQLHAARVSGSSFGPECRIGGEVEASIVHGRSNKAHDGFLGHSYVGEWVNLGAGTQASDLRNDYANVRVTIQGQKVDTGLLKVGAFIGDHAKTSLNALLNTGSVIGPFAQLLASGALLPCSLPAFSQFSKGEVRERTAIREVFATAATVMGRRGREWTDAHAALFLDVYEQTSSERRRLLHEAEVRWLRRVG